jgi:hypothetical protein
MSRTYRRKVIQGRANLAYDLKDHNTGYITPPKIDPKSKEGKRIVALYHSDNNTHSYLDKKGPGWYRRFYVQRPQRREAERQLHRWERNAEFEVILNTKDSLRWMHT